MNIIDTLRIKVHSCKVAYNDTNANFLRNYLERVVFPRMASYAVFLDQINSLPFEHSLRRDKVAIEIWEDFRQLTELIDQAARYLG